MTLFAEKILIWIGKDLEQKHRVLLGNDLLRISHSSDSILSFHTLHLYSRTLFGVVILNWSLFNLCSHVCLFIFYSIRYVNAFEWEYALNIFLRKWSTWQCLRVQRLSMSVVFHLTQQTKFRPLYFITYDADKNWNPRRSSCSV